MGRYCYDSIGSCFDDVQLGSWSSQSHPKPHKQACMMRMLKTLPASQWAPRKLWLCDYREYPLWGGAHPATNDQVRECVIPKLTIWFAHSPRCPEVTQAIACVQPMHVSDKMLLMIPSQWLAQGYGWVRAYVTLSAFHPTASIPVCFASPPEAGPMAGVPR